MPSRNVKFRGFNQNELNGNIYEKKSEIAILFCHGLATNSQDFGNFPEKLAQKGYKVLTFDYSGHGRSQGIKGLFTAKSHWQDTFQAFKFLSQQGVKKIIILGHSLGAYPALLSLKEKNIMAAILVCPSRKSGDNLPFHKKIFIWLIGWFYQVFGKLIKKEIYFKNVNLRFLSYVLKIDNLKLAKKTTKPVLLVAAKKDKDVPLEKSQDLYNKIKSREKEFLLLEKSNHNPFAGLDQDLLIKAIDSFIKIYEGSVN